MTLPQTYSLTPIGAVRSPYRTRQDVEPWGGPAAIVIAPEYEPALEGLERSTHLFVIGFLHEADRTVLRARPRRLAPDAPPLGVFCCRSPARPNPLSVTVCRLVAREGRVLHVEPLDLLDGTPIVDLKPYNPGWDDVFSARRVRRVQPPVLTDDQLAACLQRALDVHLGRAAHALAARRALAAVYAAVRHFGLDARDDRLAVATNRLDLTADALIGLLGATFASGRLQVAVDASPPRFTFTVGGCHLELVAEPQDVALIDDGPVAWRRQLRQVEP